MSWGVYVLGVSVQGVSVQGVSDWGVCVLGVSVRGYMSGGVLSCHQSEQFTFHRKNYNPMSTFGNKSNFMCTENIIPIVVIKWSNFECPCL